jgi:hypothetical protein
MKYINRVIWKPQYYRYDIKIKNVFECDNDKSQNGIGAKYPCKELGGSPLNHVRLTPQITG